MEGREDGIHRRQAATILLQGDLEAAKIVGARRVGRQAADIADVVALRLAGETPQVHLIDQALAQRAGRRCGNGQSRQ